MTEKQLIAKIKELRQIKPRQDWVVFTKRRILEKEPVEIRGRTSDSFVSVISVIIDGIKREIGFVFRHKPAFAVLTVLFVLIGVFAFAQKSVPGDTFFTLKKITEKGQTIFVSERGESKRNLELANKRLDELTKIAQDNSVKNLAPAINEYQASVSEVAKSLAKEKDTEIVKEIVIEVQKLEKKKQQIESLGAVIGENEDINEVCAQKIVETLESFIQDLENRSLTEEQGKGLAEVKEDCENGDYSQALEKLLFLTQ